MKKWIAVLLAVAVMLPCIGIGVLAKDAYILQENPLAPELPYEIMRCVDKYEINKDAGHWVYGYTALDSGHIQLNFGVDILKVYDNGALVFDSMDKANADFDACSVNWSSTIRPTDFNYAENCGDGYIDYLLPGTNISYLQAGHTYTIECAIGDDMCGEGVKVSELYPHLSSNDRPWFAFDVNVIADDGTYVVTGMYPQDGEALPDDGYDDGYGYGEDIYAPVPDYPMPEQLVPYEQSLLDISGVSEFFYGAIPFSQYEDYVAICPGSAVVTAAADLKNFVVERMFEYNGFWSSDILPLDGHAFWEPDVQGFTPAKCGETYTITEPGYYVLWAEDYAGNYTGINIEVVIVQAAYTDSKVLVDGKAVNFEAYNIKDNNYFKLRDIAAVLNGTSKQFAVEWDGVNERINLASFQPYQMVGGELAAGDGLAKTATAGTSDISLDYMPVELAAYMINGNNYFKLRDLGQLLNFDVSWDGVNNCIRIDSNNDYTPD